MGDQADGRIIAELRAIREAYAARFDYDVEAMFRDIRARQKASGREYVRLPARRTTGDRSPRRPRRAWKRIADEGETSVTSSGPVRVTVPPIPRSPAASVNRQFRPTDLLTRDCYTGWPDTRGAPVP